MTPQSENKDQLTNLVKEKPVRPVVITVICILGFIGAGFSLLALTVLSVLGSTFVIYQLALVAINVLALIWMWQMKKKGAYLYAGGFVVAQILVAVLFNAWDMGIGFFIGLAVSGTALYYSKEMQ